MSDWIERQHLAAHGWPISIRPFRPIDAASNPVPAPEYNPDDVAFRPIEADPRGKTLHEPGAKADAGKQLAGVLLDFSRALSSVADVGSMGAAKYSRGGWLAVPDAQTRYMDAMMRHLLAYGAGESTDPQSGLPHLAHCAWNILATLEIEGRAQ